MRKERVEIKKLGINGKELDIYIRKYVLFKMLCQVKLLMWRLYRKHVNF